MAATRSPIPGDRLHCDRATGPIKKWGLTPCPSPLNLDRLGTTLTKVQWEWCCVTSGPGSEKATQLPGSLGVKPDATEKSDDP